MNAAQIDAAGVGVPAALAVLPQWIVWRYVSNKGRRVKMPFNPLKLTLASTTNPGDWGTIQQACTALQTDRFTGIGFVFARGGGLFGVDLDSCFANLFDLKPWAATIVRELATYTETSPSRGGVKLFARGDFDDRPLVVRPGGEEEGEKREAIELHGRSQFFAFTGERLEGCNSEVTDGTHFLKRWVPLFRKATEKAPAPSRPSPQGAGPLSLMHRGRIYLDRVPIPKCGTGVCQSRCFRAACFLTVELGLDSRGAFTLLREWCDRSDHGWSDEDIHKKVRDAIKTRNGR